MRTRYRSICASCAETDAARLLLAIRMRRTLDSNKNVKCEISCIPMYVCMYAFEIALKNSLYD